MSAQINLAGDEELDLDSERARDLEVALTPEPVARQFVEHLSRLPRFLEEPPRNILDPGAGTGVFGKVCRERWPKAKLWAVEVREEERARLRRGYDFVTIGDFRHLVGIGTLGGGIPTSFFDLVLTNPAFGLAQDLVPLARRCLDPDGLLAFLLPLQWCFRGEDRYRWLTRCEAIGDKLFRYPNLPSELTLVPGPMAFRGGSNAATGLYAYWQWGSRPIVLPDDKAPFDFNFSALDWLPGSARSWKATPGLE